MVPDRRAGFAPHRRRRGSPRPAGEARAAIVRAIAISAAACAATVDRAADPAVPASPAPAEPVVPPTPAPAPPTTISRADLHATLDAGLGRFLSRLAVRRVLRGGRFRGWRVERFDGDALRAGDVVLAVQGRPVETPAQAQAVWDALRDADSVVVRVVRDGAEAELRWPVVEAAAAR